jgi:hypothetical protein
MTYTVNCSILLTELPLLERPAAAKAAGFDAVEFWWPFDTSVPTDASVTEFENAILNAGVQLTGLNFNAGNMPGGDRGLVSWPARSTEFLDNIDVVAGIGDKAIRGLHDADEISRIEGALREGAERPGTGDLARRIRRNAERAGNDSAALAAFFERGGWPGDLTTIGHVAAPVLVVLAERDEFMPRADELLRSIPARVTTLEDCAHAAAVRDPRFVGAALSFIREHRLPKGH